MMFLVLMLHNQIVDGLLHRNQAHNGSVRYIGILPVHSTCRFIEYALDKACLGGTRCGETSVVKESFDFGAAPFGTAPV